MRYLSLLFFVFFALCSGVVFSQPQPSCSGVATSGCVNNQYLSETFANCSRSVNNGVRAVGIRGLPANSTLTAPSCSSSYPIVYSCAFNCSCSNGTVLSGGSCVCPSGSHWQSMPASGANAGSCVPDSCPAGQIPNTISGPNGFETSCIDDPEGGGDELCPSGYPKVNGQCPVCPGGFNSDGTCIDPTSCPAGQIKQGEINGTAICKKECSDPNQSWGFVNGVEGCYGSPTCPNGGSYGTVNGVPGCYGGDGGGSGSGSSSGGAGGSSGGAGGSSGGAGGSSGGAGGSSGGSGGDGGSGGNGGGGGGGGSNNDIGSDFGGAEACPAGKIKQGNKCVSDGRGDCTIGYHELVVSRDPYLFICVKDDPPPASSAAASSQPSSNSSQASSSPSSQSASAASASAGSASSGDSGGGSSSGAGSSSGSAVTGGGSCDEAPQCTGDAVQCSQLLQQWHTRCGGELPSKFFELPDQGADKVSFSGSLKNFKTELEKLPNTQAITNFFTFRSSGSCPVWSVSVMGFNIVIDQQCSSFIPWSLIAGVIIAVASLLAARIALT